MGNNFQGELAGKTLYDFRIAIDYNIEGVENRLKQLNDALEDDTFFREYFSADNGYYSFSPVGNSVFNKNSALAEDINVCTTLESLGSYLIFEDGKEQKRELRRQQKLNQLASLDSIMEKKDADHLMIKHVEKKSPMNKQKAREYNARQREILKSQEESIENLDYIKNLTVAIEECRGKVADYMNAIESGTKVPFDSKSLYLYKKVIGELSYDLRDAKAAAYKIVTLGGCDTKPAGVNWDENEPDFTMVDDVKAFMSAYMDLKYANEDDSQSDLKWIIVDFENLVNNTELSDRDRRLYYYAIEEGFEDVKVAAEITHEFRVGYSRNNVARDISAIAKKISAQAYKEYETWYYSAIAYGNYKQCNTCGEIKLATDTYYGKKSSGKYGVKGTCKACESTKSS